MNIKNRLEKLEKRYNLDSEFCACSRETVVRVIEPDLTEEENRQLLAEAEAVEYCDRCQKQIEKRVIVIQGV